MLHFYKSNNTNYNKNGDYLIDMEAVIEKDIEMTYTASITSSYSILKDIKHDMVVRVVDDNIDQLFRINNIKISGDTVNIEAIHIYTDLLDVYIDKSYISKMTRLNAIKYCLNNTLQPHNFTLDIDSVDTIEPLDLNIEEIDNILHLLNSEDDNTLRKTYKGEIDYSNFTIKVLDKIGEDRGYLIRDGKNLETFEQDIDCTNVITRIMPETSGGLRLDELYVDSPNINNYSKIYFAHMVFSDIEFDLLPPEEQDAGYNDRKEVAMEQLREECKKLYESGADLPKITYKIELEDIRYNRKYKKISHLLNLNLGDIVKVYNRKLGIEIKQRVVSTTYISGVRAVKGRYTEISLSSLEEKFTNNYTKSTSKQNNSSSGGDNSGLLGRVVELEKGMSEIEQKWDKVEYRFSTSSINKIMNGAFINNLDFWTGSNAGIVETEVNPFSYSRESKEKDFQTSALKITNTLSNTDINKAFMLSDKFILKTGRDYTLSFKIKLQSNVDSCIVSLMKKQNDTDEEIDEQIVGIFKTNSKEYKNEKFFIDFKSDDTNTIYYLKVTHNGLIDTSLEENNSIFATEFMLAEGFGFKPFDYNDAILQGITQVDANGVLVKHSKIKTMSRMSADGYKMLDGAGNIIGQFGDSAGYITINADKIYASNVKQSISNTEEVWEVRDKNDTEKYITDSIEKILKDDYICAKNRINSALYFKDYRGGHNIENIEITDMDGAEIVIDLNKNAWYFGDLVIKNCNSTVIINGGRELYTDSTDCAKIVGQLIIENCKNVVLNGVWLQNKETNVGEHMNIFNGIVCKNSNVVFNTFNIQGFKYPGEFINSTVVFNYLTGGSTCGPIFDNTRVYVGKNGEWDSDMTVMYCHLGAFGTDLRNGSMLFKCGNGQMIDKNIEDLTTDGKLVRKFISKVSTATDLAAYNWETVSKKMYTYKDKEERLIQGYMEYEDNTKENWMSIIELAHPSELLAYYSTGTNENLDFINLEFKLRLKTRSLEDRKYKIGLAIVKTGHHIASETKVDIIKNYGVIGYAEILKDNYIKMPVEAFSLYYKNHKNDSKIAFYLTNEDNKEKECVFIDARALELQIVTKCLV